MGARQLFFSLYFFLRGDRSVFIGTQGAMYFSPTGGIDCVAPIALEIEKGEDTE